MNAVGLQMPFGDALLLSVVGMLFVFFILILLAVIVVILAKIAKKIEGRKNTATVTVANAVETTPARPQADVAQVYGGEVKLFNCSDQNAALIMAIVADNTDIPLNELIFKSIRLIDQTEVK